MEHLTTSDLFLASYVVASGEEIGEILIKQSGRQQAALFVFKRNAKRLRQLEKNFESGHAMIELLQFKASMTHVKDVMFHALRKHSFKQLQENAYQNDIRLI